MSLRTTLLNTRFDAVQSVAEFLSNAPTLWYGAPFFNQTTSICARGKPDEKLHPMIVIVSPATSDVLGRVVGPDWKAGTENGEIT